jgi:hypothetical protein|tara:strand:+ start:7282 stop:7530 length:249 start_codon:yes stop_codon:yes gene_type:complete
MIFNVEIKNIEEKTNKLITSFNDLIHAKNFVYSEINKQDLKLKSESQEPKNINPGCFLDFRCENKRNESIYFKIVVHTKKHH